jgi:hypothetical protein
MRERRAVAFLLMSYYEVNFDGRFDFLFAIESQLVDLRDGTVLPFAAAPLLTCLARAMELSLAGQEDEFRRILINAVLPLVWWPHLEIAFTEIVSVFTRFIASSPDFALEVLIALQKKWPYSTREETSARMAIAIFCVMERSVSDPLAPSFFHFMASGLRSPDSLLVHALLGIFERPDGVEVIRAYAGHAIAYLYAPLRDIRDRHWWNKLHAVAELGLSVIASVDPDAFELAAASPPGEAADSPTIDFFPLTKWQAVINLAATRDDGLDEEELIRQVSELCICVRDSEFNGIPKIVPGKRGDRAVVARHKRLRGVAQMRPGKQNGSVPPFVFQPRTAARARISFAFPASGRTPQSEI